MFLARRIPEGGVTDAATLRVSVTLKKILINLIILSLMVQYIVSNVEQK
jgi:hypothetical protein